MCCSMEIENSIYLYRHYIYIYIYIYLWFSCRLSELRWSVPVSEICLWLVFIGSFEETGLDLWSTWFLGFRECQQITFVTLNIFCLIKQLLPRPPPPPKKKFLLFLTGNIKMDKIPTKIKRNLFALNLIKFGRYSYKNL